MAIEAVSTIRNFPNTRCVRDTGLQRIVSIVPRSFSPAVRSIAGYIAPVRHNRMTKYGNNSAEDRSSHFLRGRNILLLDVERPHQALGKVLRLEMFTDGPVAQVPEEFLQPVRAET